MLIKKRLTWRPASETFFAAEDAWEMTDCDAAGISFDAWKMTIWEQKLMGADPEEYTSPLQC